MDSAVLGRVHAPVAAIVEQRFVAAVGLPRELEIPQIAAVTPLCIPGEYVASVVAL